jgi:hypothetical protein
VRSILKLVVGVQNNLGNVGKLLVTDLGSGVYFGQEEIIRESIVFVLLENRIC